MPPNIALLIGIVFVLWLLHEDIKQRKIGSWTLLIPGIWITIQSSRPISYWLNLSGSGGEGDSPIDTALAVGLIVGAMIAIGGMKVRWGELIKLNKALFAIYGYFALSVIWSDEPFLSLKRIIKDFGMIPIVLILLSQRDPAEAIRVVYVRVSYILFSISVVMIKWFPEIGRQSRHSGDSMFRGVALHKSSLGLIVFLLSLMLLWDLFEIAKRRENLNTLRRQIAIRAGMLLIGGWLLAVCESKTSLLCLILGVFVFWGANRLVQIRQGRGILVACLVLAIGLIAVDKTFRISEIAIQALGKDPSLTGRTEIWQYVKEQNTDPLVGNGFYVFWDTSKGKAVVEEFMQIKSTHNGYLEAYVDGGICAGVLLVLLLLVTLGKVVNRLFAGGATGAVGLVFWVLAVVYNLSESSFFRPDLMWFTLLLIAVECPQLQTRPVHRILTANQSAMLPA